tara:strand:+ start:678 stop:872 length:195 start_codon:yes stop_codon:yes gene_type:complete
MFIFVTFATLQIIAGLCMAVFGVALVESPDLITACIGGLMATIGLLVAITFSILIAKTIDNGEF